MNNDDWNAKLLNVPLPKFLKDLAESAAKVPIFKFKLVKINGQWWLKEKDWTPDKDWTTE